MDPKDILKSRFTTVVLVGMLAMVMFVTAKLLVQKREVDTEIGQLKSESDRINRENQQLSELIKYLGTSEYAERQAREQLNMQKPGEQVVVLPKESDQQNSASETAPVKSNPRKWLDYFFATN
ncbi:MAG: FtsB family cell division protein [Acidobacteriaceae bacterium]